MNSNDSGSNDRTRLIWQGILGLTAVVVVSSAVLFYAIGLIILASLVTLGSIAVGVSLILRSYDNGDATFRAILGEIERLSNDASFDISEELITWDKMKYTKGIGTNLEGQITEIDDIHRRLVNSREELAQAETPAHRIEAVLSADSILALAKELRTPARTAEQG